MAEIRISSTHKNTVSTGSSNALQTTVNNHLARLPSGTQAIFTDGSATGNPGPTGAGAVFFNSTRPTEANFEINASIGVATNNGGELFAIGLGVEIAEHSDYSGPIHVYTDSMIVKNALTKNTTAGNSNSALLQRVN